MMAKQTCRLQQPEYKEIEAYLTCSYDYLTCPIIGLEKCGKLELLITNSTLTYLIAFCFKKNSL
jgi:hypothetical protein